MLFSSNKMSWLREQGALAQRLLRKLNLLSAPSESCKLLSISVDTNSFLIVVHPEIGWNLHAYRFRSRCSTFLIIFLLIEKSKSTRICGCTETVFLAVTATFRKKTYNCTWIIYPHFETNESFLYEIPSVLDYGGTRVIVRNSIPCCQELSNRKCC